MADARMREGGRALASIKQKLQSLAVPGISFEALEAEAQRLILSYDMKPSFSTVSGYHWATCIMKNDELCHGIPMHKQVADGDVITIDVGLINQSFHVDTTTTFAVGTVSEKIQKFLRDGREILDKAISRARAGNTVYDVSFEMEKGLKRRNYGAVYQLTGHGVGEELHMDPEVPVVAIKSTKKHRLYADQTLAIEVMYTMGKPDLIVDKDAWTYRTADGSLSGMFEETIIVTEGDPEVLTKIE